MCSSWRQLVFAVCIVLCLYNFFVLAGSVLMLFILVLLVLDKLHWPSWYKPKVGTIHYLVSPLLGGLWRIDSVQWTGTAWIFLGTETSTDIKFMVPCIIDYGRIGDAHEKVNDKSRQDQPNVGG